MKKILLLVPIIALIISCAAVPHAYADTSQAGGPCGDELHDCAIGLTCNNGICQNASIGNNTGSAGTGGNSVGNGGSFSVGNNTGSNSGGCGTGGTGLQSPLKDCDLITLLKDVLQFIITIGGIAVVLMLIYCGFKFVAAQGNEEKLRDARSMLMWTVIGALVLLGSQAIESGIEATIQSLTS